MAYVSDMSSSNNHHMMHELHTHHQQQQVHYVRSVQVRASWLTCQTCHPPTITTWCMNCIHITNNNKLIMFVQCRFALHGLHVRHVILQQSSHDAWTAYTSPTTTSSLCSFSAGSHFMAYMSDMSSSNNHNMMHELHTHHKQQQVHYVRLVRVRASWLTCQTCPPPTITTWCMNCIHITNNNKFIMFVQCGFAFHGLRVRHVLLQQSPHDAWTAYTSPTTTTPTTCTLYTRGYIREFRRVYTNSEGFV